MAISLRRSLVLIAIVVVVVGLVAYARYGYRGGSSGSSASEQNAQIGVATSQYYLTVENRAGLTLYDMEIAIVPVGRATLFTVSWGRMASKEKRDFPLSNFRGRDGTPFNMALHRPRSVLVTAKDMNGTPYKVETPWK